MPKGPTNWTCTIASAPSVQMQWDCLAGTTAKAPAPYSWPFDGSNTFPRPKPTRPLSTVATSENGCVCGKCLQFGGNRIVRPRHLIRGQEDDFTCRGVCA